MNIDVPLVLVGRIGAAYGVRGWVKVHSHTDPAANLLDYRPWVIELRDRRWQVEPVDAKPHGKGLVAHLPGCSSRDDAQNFTGAGIWVPRDRLPSLAPHDYYWSDLIGLQVVTVAGVELGVVEQLLETGANDVLVIRGEQEHLVPFCSPQFVRQVDLDGRRILVDWDSDD